MITAEQMSRRRQEETEHDTAARTLEGARITTARYTDPHINEDWNDHGEYRLTLNDGRTITFTSTGYDASDVWMEILP